MEQAILTITDISRMLEPVFIQNNVKRAAVFGSYARGEQDGSSDMDFVVEFTDGASLLDLGGLFEDVREMTGRNVDIITYRTLAREPESFSLNVLRDAKVIYEVS